MQIIIWLFRKTMAKLYPMILSLAILFCQTALFPLYAAPVTNKIEAPASQETISSIYPATKEFESGLGYDAITRGLSPWQHYYIEGVYRYGVRKTLYGRIQHTDRFSVTDEELIGGLYHPISRRNTGVIEASISPSHHALANKSVFAQLQTALPGGWGVHLGHRNSSHPDTTVNISSLTIENYFSDYRGAYTLNISNLSNTGPRTSNSLRLSRYYDNSSFTGLALTMGQEAEFIALL